jgi:glycosyltransferase involved in cell wall biosynthesis
LTSFFSPLGIKFLTLRRLGMTPDVPVVLAPEGEFSPGALQLKATKKKIFRKLAFPGRLYRDLIWKAASEPEREDIRRVAGEGCEIFIAPNMPPRVILESYAFEQKPLKRTGAARLVFLSRVVPKKNVLHTLEILPNIEGEIEFDIYGPLEDEAYWAECQQLIAKMPANIKVTHRGSIPYEAVAETMTGYHYFVLPTLGENFGHVMPEAFSAGCPVVISDQTPWRNLAEKNIGWDLPLERTDLWREALQKCVMIGGTEYEQQSRAARQYAIDWLAAPEIVAANARVLDRALMQGKVAISSAA